MTTRLSSVGSAQVISLVGIAAIVLLLATIAGIDFHAMFPNNPFELIGKI